MLAAAGFAAETGPDAVEVVHGRGDEGGVVREDARLEVARARPLHADAGAREIGRADVRYGPVEDEQLEMDAGAQRPLQPREEHGVAVELLAEVRTRLLRVDQADLPAFGDQVGDEAQEGPVADIQVLDVGRADPQRAPNRGHA